MSKLKLKANNTKYTGKSRLWNITCLLTGIMLLAWSQAGMAYTGWCTAQGGTYTFNVNAGNVIVTDPSKNKAGTVFYEVYNWNLGGTYNSTCDCPGTTNPGQVYFHTSTTLPYGHTDGNLTYYRVNDYLQVATEIWLAASVQAYLPTPWDNEGNGGGGAKVCGGNYYPVSTGSTGKMSLYIAKPFVGSVSFNTTVVNLYESTVSNSFGGTPTARVSIQGNVTVPQNCTVSPQTIPVHFGTMNSGDFTVKGQKPVSGSTQTINIPIKCTSATAYANLKVSLQATPSSGYPEAISTTNKDVGVLVTSEDGSRVLAPNSSTGYVPFMPDASGNATVTLKTYPVSTTGMPPVAGPFTALAYVLIDFA
ncbi:fimbrial protein [Klebsiella aerogenes]|uniref:fimbrial protein n=1 Tax=Klebsiella aerogenes TaxID=548 RepID=UPI0034D1B475